MAKNCNYWFSTHKADFEVTAGLPRNADVAIIGGGVAGFSLLFDLVTNTSLSVVLLEGDSPAFHTSGRVIGHVPEIDPISLDHIRLTRGEDVASMYVEGMRLNNDWLRETVRREQIDCDYQKTGGIYVSLKKDDERLDRFIDFNQDSHRQHFDKAGLQSLVPSTAFERAVYVPGEATINPYRYVHGLREACEQVGRQFIPNASVQRVVRMKDGFKLYVRNRGTINASAVVYCTGGYTVDLLRQFKGNVALWKTHVVGSSKIPDEAVAYWPRQPIVNLDKTTRIYRDRILLSGGIDPVQHPACDGTVEQSSFQRLNSWWRSVFPSIPKSISANSVWSYINCTGKDGLPLIGPIKGRPGEYMNVGVGLNFAFISAFMLRSYLAEGSPDDDRWQAFHPSRALPE